MKFPPSTSEMTAAQSPLRDSFAAAALTGMLAKSDLSAGKPAAAVLAYAYADAMIAERNKKQPAPPALTELNPIAILSPQETTPFTPSNQILP